LIFGYPDPATAAPGVSALLHVEVDGDPQGVTVKVRGDVDTVTAHVLSAAVAFGLRAEPRELVIELSQVSFFGAAGLNVLLAARHRAEAHGTGLVLQAPPGQLLTVLGLAGVEGLFQIQRDPQPGTDERSPA
jgi:anti-sigma B factor antagonist